MKSKKNKYYGYYYMGEVTELSWPAEINVNLNLNQTSMNKIYREAVYSISSRPGVCKITPKAQEMINNPYLLCWKYDHFFSFF